MEFAKDGTALLRQKILSVLDELLFHKDITYKENMDIKEDSKIDHISYTLIIDGGGGAHYADQKTKISPKIHKCARKLCIQAKDSFKDSF